MKWPPCYCSAKDHQFRISEIWTWLKHYIDTGNDVEARYWGAMIAHIGYHLLDRHAS